MTRLPLFPLLAALLCSWGCATRYGYRVDLADPHILEDADVSAAIEADPTGAREVTLHLTNKTSEPLAVRWTRISLIGPEGHASRLRPDSDLGWVAPAATQVARLSPFTLPDSGSDALASDGARFELDVPMSPRGEERVYRIPFTVHVAPVKEAR